MGRHFYFARLCLSSLCIAVWLLPDEVFLLVYFKRICCSVWLRIIVSTDSLQKTGFLQTTKTEEIKYKDKLSIHNNLRIIYHIRLQIRSEVEVWRRNYGTATMNTKAFGGGPPVSQRLSPQIEHFETLNIHTSHVSHTKYIKTNMPTWQRSASLSDLSTSNNNRIFDINSKTKLKNTIKIIVLKHKVQTVATSL